MSLSSGAKLGPYEVVGPLGADGMGEVYRAHDALLVLSGRMVGNSSITGLWNDLAITALFSRLLCDLCANRLGRLCRNSSSNFSGSSTMRGHHRRIAPVEPCRRASN